MASFTLVLWCTAIGLPLHGASWREARAEYPVQSNPSFEIAADTVPVMLVLADRLHIGWARASIVRPVGDGPDAIVVSRETTVADLEKAVRMLLSSRADVEPPLRNQMHAHVSPTRSEPEPSPLVEVLSEGLRRLPESKPMYVADYGTVPTMLIDLPVEESAGDEVAAALPAALRDDDPVAARQRNRVRHATRTLGFARGPSSVSR